MHTGPGHINSPASSKAELLENSQRHAICCHPVTPNAGFYRAAYLADMVVCVLPFHEPVGACSPQLLVDSMKCICDPIAVLNSTARCGLVHKVPIEKGRAPAVSVSITSRLSIMHPAAARGCMALVIWHHLPCLARTPHGHRHRVPGMMLDTWVCMLKQLYPYRMRTCQHLCFHNTQAFKSPSHRCLQQPLSISLNSCPHFLKLLLQSSHFRTTP